MSRVDAKINLASGFCNRWLVSCLKMRIVMLGSGANEQYLRGVAHALEIRLFWLRTLNYEVFLIDPRTKKEQKEYKRSLIDDNISPLSPFSIYTSVI
ncbi:hypothetical protein C9413_13345 [Rhizobium sp. SEMIA 4085]|uniref:hypothetical protein n=1 Tax=Rhizobium TaxID=379 RepID=UPI000586B482|nr:MULTISPECIES: hypothetical protein [Rhizobium]NNH30455.1 hypothetical protein [Rhizobium sp. SEMIA 4085]